MNILVYLWNSDKAARYNKKMFLKPIAAYYWKKIFELNNFHAGIQTFKYTNLMLKMVLILSQLR